MPKNTSKKTTESNVAAYVLSDDQIAKIEEQLDIKLLSTKKLDKGRVSLEIQIENDLVINPTFLAGDKFEHYVSEMSKAQHKFLMLQKIDAPKKKLEVAGKELSSASDKVFSIVLAEDYDDIYDYYAEISETGRMTDQQKQKLAATVSALILPKALELAHSSTSDTD